MPNTRENLIEWIPVTERLPEKQKDVLVVVNDSDDTYVDMDMLMRDGSWRFEHPNRVVTHWMPLPEPANGKNPNCAYGRWDCKPCTNCDAYIPTKTNADRIRAMSDEELEDGIRKIAVGYEPWCDHHCKMEGDDDCNVCLQKWLKQPMVQRRNLRKCRLPHVL